MLHLSIFIVFNVCVVIVEIKVFFRSFNLCGGADRPPHENQIVNYNKCDDNILSGSAESSDEVFALCVS